jgi:hypothetical protein
VRSAPWTGTPSNSEPNPGLLIDAEAPASDPPKLGHGSAFEATRQARGQLHPHQPHRVTLQTTLCRRGLYAGADRLRLLVR